MQGHPLAKGLVGAWLMNDNAGSVVLDASGNGNSGTMTSSPQWSSGAYGPCLSFDGNDDLINCGDGIYISGNDVVAISYRIKPSSSQKNSFDVRIVNSAWNEIASRYNATSGCIDFIMNSFTANDRVSSSNSSVPADTWSDVVAQYDGNDLSIWVNGKLNNSVTPSGSYSQSTYWTIGANGDQANYEYAGLIDNVLIFKRALSAYEIYELHLDPYQMFHQGNIIPFLSNSGGSSGPSIPVIQHYRRQH